MFTTQNLASAAASMGMDSASFSSCLNNKSDQASVDTDLSDGEKAGVSGTPTFFINGVQLVGDQPYSAFQTAINQALSGSN